jgi:hypothetical protein
VRLIEALVVWFALVVSFDFGSPPNVIGKGQLEDDLTLFSARCTRVLE